MRVGVAVKPENWSGVKISKPLPSMCVCSADESCIMLVMLVMQHHSRDEEIHFRSSCDFRRRVCRGGKAGTSRQHEIFGGVVDCDSVRKKGVDASGVVARTRSRTITDHEDHQLRIEVAVGEERNKP